MNTFFIVTFFILLLIAVPAFVISLVIMAVKKKPLKNILIAFGICGALIVSSFIGVGVTADPYTPEEIAQQEQAKQDKIAEREQKKLEKEQVKQDLPEKNILDKSYKKLNKYPWGQLVSEELQKMGVKEIKKIRPIYSEILKYDSEIIIETDIRRLELRMFAEFNDLDKYKKPTYNWEISAIQNADTKKYYMGVSHYDGKPIVDLYDYKTDTIISLFKY